MKFWQRNIDKVLELHLHKEGDIMQLISFSKVNLARATSQIPPRFFRAFQVKEILQNAPIRETVRSKTNLIEALGEKSFNVLLDEGVISKDLDVFDLKKVDEKNFPLIKESFDWRKNEYQSVNTLKEAIFGRLAEKTDNNFMERYGTDQNLVEFFVNQLVSGEVAIWSKFAHEWNGKRINLSGLFLRGADLKKANFRKIDLIGADLSAANLEDAKFNKTNLSMANLHEANLKRAYFNEALLTDTDLSGSDLSSAYFFWTTLHRANLSFARLEGTKLDSTKFIEVDLTGAILTNLRLFKRDFIGTDISKAYLQRVRYYD